MSDGKIRVAPIYQSFFLGYKQNEKAKGTEKNEI